MRSKFGIRASSSHMRLGYHRMVGTNQREDAGQPRRTKRLNLRSLKEQAEGLLEAGLPEDAGSDSEDDEGQILQQTEGHIYTAETEHVEY